MLHLLSIPTAFVLCAASPVLAQDAQRAALLNSANLETPETRALRARAAKLEPRRAAQLREQLASAPDDIETRLLLLYFELPELRRARGQWPDPKPHGALVLGLIEQHPRSRLAGNAGLLLYPYKRDGLYTGPAWEAGIALWERLVAAYPKDPAIACNAGAFLISDPFRFEQTGARALELFSAARELAPQEPRWALALGAYHFLQQSMTRDAARSAQHARAGLPHLRAAWDRTAPAGRAALDIHGEPLSMVLASVYFELGDAQRARRFAVLALKSDDPAAPRGTLVYEMNAVLGRLALAAGDLDGAARHLLAAGKTPGSATLGSFGPDLALARGLLAAGRRETVLAFLASCKVFWHSGAEKLDVWMRAIEAGENPWSDAPRR